MSRDGRSSSRRGSGLNNANLTGCVLSRPRLTRTGGKPECRFLFGDDVDVRRAKLVIEAVAKGDRAVELDESLEVGMRVAVTGMYQAEPVAFAGGEILGYELVVSHLDPGPPLVGESTEGAGINVFVISGTVTRSAEVEGMPGNDQCVFWVCDGDGKEASRVELPVHLQRGRVSEMVDGLQPGDRVAVSGFVCSHRQPVSGSWVSEYRLVAVHIDEGFLALRGVGDE